MFSRGLHKRYGDKIIINSVHPGGVNTELKRGVIESFPIFNYLGWIVDPILYLIFLTPEQGALASLYAATSPEIEEKDYRNRYIVPYGAVSDRVNPLALDDKLAEELWDFSTKAVEKFKSNKK